MTAIAEHFRRRAELRDCKQALDEALELVVYLTDLLQQAGIRHIYSITLINQESEQTMKVGSTATATVTYKDANGNSEAPPAGTVAEFNSSDANVATVDPTSGLVTVVGVGSADIGCHSVFPDGVAQDAASATVTGEPADPASSVVTVA